MNGIYVLIINLEKEICTCIGALGLLTFLAGSYAYVGSAQKSLKLRVARHLRKEKRLFWHIDYLLNNAAVKVVGVYYIAGEKAKECQIANIILNKGGEPIPKFGSSDCSCTSHLFFTNNVKFLEDRMQTFFTI